MRHEVIEVENIKCGGCVNSIRKEILKQTGVLAVHVDEEHDSIQISGDDDMDREHIVARLIHLGYPPKGENGVLLKAKSYVSCAIGRMGKEEVEV
jgi:copper chaperone